jgi:hydrogenase maturation protein HypF
MKLQATTTLQRLRITVRGAVQGVGFRPFVYRLAKEVGLAGWVQNSPHGVLIEVEGARIALDSFLLRLAPEKPPRSFIHSLEHSWLDAAGVSGFEIRKSEAGGPRETLVLPDIATCPDCLREIFDPTNRRFGHAFANCTNCGPRFTIIESLPYDRGNTTMRAFTMCPQCRAEYDDPSNRRFHAQPNACPLCGPRLSFWTGRTGKHVADLTAEARVSHTGHDAHYIKAAARAIRAGAIVAVKGVGGFHLMCAAHDEAAVGILRERKQREEKPFAVMFPSLEDIRAECEVSPMEERLLASPEAPIVLLQRKVASPDRNGHPRPSSLIAPGNPLLGALLPSNPLHHLLVRKLGQPVIATSGNVADEPIYTDEQEALERLGGIADYFLIHDRPILRHADDSIVRTMAGREMVLRRARGFAPLPIPIRDWPTDGRPILGVGPHLKSSVTLATGAQAFISQHIGDLEGAPALAAFRRVSKDVPRLFGAAPATVACDNHPDYLSTHWAEESGLPVVRVQHHIAHVLSCMAENELKPPILGVSWDGTGQGLDGTVWGGEFFEILSEENRWTASRIGNLRPYPLPGGEAAVKEPRRSALGLLFAAFGDAAFEMRELPSLQAFRSDELITLRRMLTRGLNSPLTSSAGRLFDAVASLAGLRQITRFEGQSAMALEFAAAQGGTEEAYPWVVAEDASGQSRLILDWQPLVESVLEDVRDAIPAGIIAAKFQNALTEGVVTVAQRTGHARVALGGGCFQNKRLLELTVARLTSEGFQPYWPQRVPPNDGGISLGQVVAAARHLHTVPFQPCASPSQEKF